MVIRIPDGLVFDASGLVPVVAQDRASGDVLMVRVGERRALERTAETGIAHFWSRSRKAFWKKGETPARAAVVEARADCDRTRSSSSSSPRARCHTGARTCFANPRPPRRGCWRSWPSGGRARPGPGGGVVHRTAPREGPDQVLKKIGEEATEVVLAARVQSDERLAEESADLLYHLLVALHQRACPSPGDGRAAERRNR